MNNMKYFVHDWGVLQLSRFSNLRKVPTDNRDLITCNM